MKAAAIVTGASGRLGSALALRLTRDGYMTVPIDQHNQHDWWIVEGDRYLFECAFDPNDIEGHLRRASIAMSRWRDYAGIFIPSSYWIGTDTPYGRAKLVIEQMAKFYNGQGANIVTDRIGYFPGDGGVPDQKDQFHDKLVTGDELYARIMEKLL